MKLLAAVPSRGAVSRLSLARAISLAGSTSAFVALAAVVYAMTGSAAWVGAAALASFATPALTSPLVGLIADRHDRRRLMICSELLGALCFAGMAFLSAPAALIAVRVLAAGLTAPVVPVTGAVLPAVAPEGDLAWANSRLAIAGTIGGLVGPLVGGVLVAGDDGSLVFALNAASSVVAAGLIWSIRANLRPDPAQRSERRGLGAGFSHLLRSPELRPVTLAFAIVFLAIGLTIPAEVALADLFGAGSSGYGGLVAVWAVGGLVGARLAGGVARKWRQISVLTASAAGMTIAFFVVGQAPVFALALLATGAAGACEGLWQVTQQVLLQRSAPDSIRGRVLAGNEAIAQGGFVVSLLFAGFLVDSAGARTVFLLAGLVCGLASLVLLWGLLRVPRDHGERVLPAAVELPVVTRR